MTEDTGGDRPSADFRSAFRPELTDEEVELARQFGMSTNRTLQTPEERRCVQRFMRAVKAAIDNGDDIHKDVPVSFAMAVIWGYRQTKTTLEDFDER